MELTTVPTFVDIDIYTGALVSASHPVARQLKLGQRLYRVVLPRNPMLRGLTLGYIERMSPHNRASYALSSGYLLSPNE